MNEPKPMKLGYVISMSIALLLILVGTAMTTKDPGFTLIVMGVGLVVLTITFAASNPQP